MLQKLLIVILTTVCLVTTGACSRKAKSSTKKKKAESGDAMGPEGGAASPGGTDTSSDGFGGSDYSTYTSTSGSAGMPYGSNSGSYYPNSNTSYNTGYSTTPNGFTPSTTTPQVVAADGTRAVAKLGSLATPSTNDQVMITWNQVKDIADDAKATVSVTYSAVPNKTNKVLFKPTAVIIYKNRSLKTCRISITDITTTAGQPEPARCEG